jgi:DUF971 family protein
MLDLRNGEADYSGVVRREGAPSRNRASTTTMSLGTTEQKPWPTELRLRKAGHGLLVSFDTGESFELPAELLRVRSPSAEVQGHAPSERITVPGKRDVAIIEVHPVGNYAVRLVFDDLHGSGIFTWEYFHDFGHNLDRYWREYLDELAEKGLSRDPPPRRTG